MREVLSTAESLHLEFVPRSERDLRSWQCLPPFMRHVYPAVSARQPGTPALRSNNVAQTTVTARPIASAVS